MRTLMKGFAIQNFWTENDRQQCHICDNECSWLEHCYAAFQTVLAHKLMNNLLQVFYKQFHFGCHVLTDFLQAMFGIY